MHQDYTFRLSAKSSPARTQIIPIPQDFVEYSLVFLPPTPGLIYLHRQHCFSQGLRAILFPWGKKKQTKKAKKAELQLFRVPWKRRKTDVSSYPLKIHRDQCLNSILLCPSCDCLIRCWFTQSWDTRKQGCKPQRQRKSNACSASFCISKAQKGHPVLRSKTCVFLPINQSITSFQPFHIKKKIGKKKTYELFQRKMIVNSLIILACKSQDQHKCPKGELPGQALKPWEQCPCPSGNPGPGCFRISGFLLGFVCLLLEKEYKLFFCGFIPVKWISWPP